MLSLFRLTRRQASASVFASTTSTIASTTVRDHSQAGTLQFRMAQESLEEYKAGGYHPVKIGDQFQSRYSIIGKLGWGMYSTVWLALDSATNSRVALKILVAKYSADLEEAAKLEAIRDCNPHHPGHSRVGQLLDHFEHQGPHGTHTCLVLELLGPSVHLLQHATAAHSPFFPMEVVKQISRDMLMAIDYMHTSCRLIHTDLKQSNILLSEPIEDLETLKAQEVSATLLETVRRSSGNPVFKVADVGHANWIDNHLTYLVQPRALRAPEVILGMDWDEKIEVWSIGCLIFELAMGKPLINPWWKLEERKISAPESHILQIIEMFGEIPKDMQESGKFAERYFDDAGKLKFNATIVPISLETIVGRLNDPLLAPFLGTLLKIRPSDRSSPSAALLHPWLAS